MTDSCRSRLSVTGTRFPSIVAVATFPNSRPAEWTRCHAGRPEGTYYKP